MNISNDVLFEEKLKTIVENSLRKVLREFLDDMRLEIILANTPYVDDEEQSELEETFGKEPSFEEIVLRKKSNYERVYPVPRGDHFPLFS